MAGMSQNTRGALTALLAFALYATHDVVVKFLGEQYSAFQIVFFSGLLGFPLVTTMLMSDRSEGNLLPRHPWWSLVRTLATAVTAVTCFYAFSTLPLAQTYAILFAMPLLITLLAIPMLGERVGIRRGGAIIVGLIGVLIVLRPGQAELGLGHLAALTAAISGSIAAVIVRKIGQDERSVVLILYPMVANFVIMGAMLPFAYRPMPIEHLGLLAVMSALGFLATLLVIRAYRTTPAVIVAPMQYSQILWAALYGTLFFGEGVDLFTGIGAGTIIASGVYIVLREDRGSGSENRPVLESRSRHETGIQPRISLLLRWRDGRN